MAKRGRKSAAALSVVAVLPGQRAEPPAELTEAEAVEWRAIIGRMPADWFTRETHPLLVALCQRIVTHRMLAAAVNDFKPARLKTASGRKALNELLQMRDREGKMMTSLATRLRLTPQSRYNAQAAHTAAKSAGSAPLKPWEFGKPA